MHPPHAHSHGTTHYYAFPTMMEPWSLHTMSQKSGVVGAYVISAIGRLGQEDYHEFEVNLGY